MYRKEKRIHPFLFVVSVSIDRPMCFVDVVRALDLRFGMTRPVCLHFVSLFEVVVVLRSIQQTQKQQREQRMPSLFVPIYSRCSMR